MNSIISPQTEVVTTCWFKSKGVLQLSYRDVSLECNLKRDDALNKGSLQAPFLFEFIQARLIIQDSYQETITKRRNP